MNTMVDPGKTRELGWVGKSGWAGAGTTLIAMNLLVLIIGWCCPNDILQRHVVGLILSMLAAAFVYGFCRRTERAEQAQSQAIVESTDRTKAQRSLLKQTYRAFFASATDGFIVLDDDDVILEANPAACRMHGWQVGTLAGVNVRELIGPNSLHQYRVFKERDEAAGVFRADAEHLRKDGTTIEIEVRASRLRLGNERRMIAVFTDVTERNRAGQRLGMLSRKALMAQEEERARVSRDLHDELGQLLTASRFELGWLEKHTSQMPQEASIALQRAVEAVEQSAHELRRICRGLRPPLLDDLGLEPAVRLLTQDHEDRTGMRVDLESHVDESVAMSNEISLCTYRILQESLNNISRHAGATSVDVTLVCGETELMLSVYDNGKGFDVEALAAASGVGITGMRERASLVGGLVEIRSAPHHGTRVVFRVPLTTRSGEETP
ncbi:MAG TPA: PAS domain-containing sensor histidine kinase [Polyangiaceae bacterium]|jgi:PAS domain S-box-containing protein|nr:MAG: Oxygen sensor histidine kinase NreB [Deltaproteobacteria bacterium ADurb.Bin207]HNZ21706.1 PAS domain-containing sensor histidine kinase [Polyangiaceae bacterium]HOD21628.1 PAS domain-containing sensor histidine kinase [Polyangiaceae bacterium]HOE49545.1 PAS domain-containing sensor histidine kinase [Polyangiaceae bacterium]HOG99733.1 PAS domain-containing sensor histidine kinase [Polyangiaceae bacterium]